MYRIAYVLLALLTAPIAATAQTVIGHALDATTRSPIRGAFVVLLDQTGRRLIGVLSDEAGRFVIRAPAPGTYRLQASLIGYQTASVQEVRLESEQSSRVELPMAVQPLQFSAIEVRGRRQCRPGPKAAAETARIWEEVRKALEVASWVREQAASFRIVSSRRDDDLDNRAAGQVELTFPTSVAPKAFVTAPVDSLLSEGFILEKNGQVLYHGPDADLLMSEQFLNSYCFSVVRDDKRAGLIGLAFEPREKRHVGIEGALWVDERGGELRYIDYQFTGTRFRGRAASMARGRTEFTRLPTGAWIVQQWNIRMPRFDRSGILVGSTLEGSELLGMHWLGVEVNPIVLSGTVFDSLAGKPMTDTRVLVMGTYAQTRTDSAGRFSVELPPGEYYLGIENPVIDVLPLPLLPKRIRVAETANAPVHLAIPSRETLLEEHCRPDDIRTASRRTGLPQSRFGVLSGILRDSVTGAPLKATVTVGWNFGQIHRKETGSDNRGRFILCGVPTDLPLLLEVRIENSLLHSETVDRLDQPFNRIDLLLPPGPRRKVQGEDF